MIYIYAIQNKLHIIKKYQLYFYIFYFILFYIIYINFYKLNTLFCMQKKNNSSVNKLLYTKIFFLV